MHRVSVVWGFDVLRLFNVFGFVDDFLLLRMLRR